MVDREDVLRAAARVLAERGLDAARLRDVARAAGVSIGALQHHFDTRDDLFREAFEWSIEQLIARWRASAADEPDPWHRFELLVQALTGDPELERRCATWTEFCASAARHPGLRDGVRSVHEEWRTLLTGIVEDGVIQGTSCPCSPWTRRSPPSRSWSTAATWRWRRGRHDAGAVCGAAARHGPRGVRRPGAMSV